MAVTNDQTLAAAPPPASAARWVTSLCWIAVLLDGFDLVVLGAVIPSLLDYEPWGLDAAAASAIATAGLVGMTVGALATGTVTDVIGRRKAIIGAVALFSFFTLLCAFAPNPTVFGVLRFLAGLGLGGCLPTAIAMVNEFARAGRGGSATTRVMTGYHVGAVATALLAIVVIPTMGWRAMFVIGALPALIVIPLMISRLPESPSYLLARGRTDTRERGASNPVAALFGPRYLRTSLALWATSFMGLLLVYGLNTWLPTIMRAAGYELGAALAFLLVLNVGAVVGLLIAGRVADRVGPRRAAIGWFTLAALFLALLSVKLPIGGIYLMVFLAGCFVFSSQVLVYAFTSAAHPAEIRATALGWSAGVGRVGAICGPLLGGALLTAGYAVPWGFYIFAVVGALGAVAMTAAAAVRDRTDQSRPGVVHQAG